MSEEIEVIGLEEQIESTLVKSNVTEAILANIESFKKLKLKDLNDKEGYIEICERRKEARQVRLTAKELCKKGREEAVSIQKKWVSKEKEITGRIELVEDYLKSQEDIFEAEKERIKQEKIRKEEENLSKRQQELFQMGATIKDGKFVLEDVEVDLVLIREASDESYADNILSEFLPIFQRNEEIRIAKEKADQEQRDAQAAEKKRIEAEIADLNRQRDEIKKQAEELRIQKEEAEKEKNRIAQQQKQKMIDERGVFLKNLGFAYDFSGQSYNYSGPEFTSYVALSDIENKTTDEWETLTHQMPDAVAKDKATKAENERLFIEEEKRKAVEKELEAERDRVKKQKEADEEKARLDKIAEQEKMDAANDDQKWLLWKDKFLSGITYPEMKGNKGRKKIAIAKEKIEEILKLT